MFDPRFKSLKVVENYVGHGACICLVAKYDVNAIILLLMTMFEVLNLIIQACVVQVVGFVVDSVTLLKKIIIYLVWENLWKSHHVYLLLLSCFCSGGYLYPLPCVDPLNWWWIHETQFLNVSFLVKQILGILGS
jgi:hypothetical protein